MKMTAAPSTTIFLLFLSSCIVAVAPVRRTGLRDPPVPLGAKPLPPQWIEQKLDHFNKTDMRIWKQRYFVNDTFWSKDIGPVFLMLGGEGPANPAWLVANTEMMINAQQFKALAILIEHRWALTRVLRSHTCVDARLMC